MLRSSPPPLALRPAAAVPLQTIADVFNDAYRDYAVPMHLTEATLERMVQLFDVDLGASRVGWVHQEPAALALLALRGARAWVAGVGVTPAMRGRGYGAAVTRGAVEQAASRGAREMWLEVLETNLPARRIYDTMGFEAVQRLGVWARPASAGPVTVADGDVAEIEPAEALRFITPRRPPGACWQRDTATFARGLPYYRGLAWGDPAAPRAVALFSTAPDVVDIMELVSLDGDPDQRAAYGLAQTLAMRHPTSMVRMVNYADDDPSVPLFRELGATSIWWQCEMVLRR